MKFLEVDGGVLAPSVIVLIEDADYPTDCKALYHAVHYKYSSTETRTAYSSPEAVERFLDAND